MASTLVWILTHRSALKVHEPYISHKIADSHFTRAFIVIQALVSHNGWGGPHSDYEAYSVQLLLQLPTGTELVNNCFLFKPQLSSIKPPLQVSFTVLHPNLPTQPTPPPPRNSTSDQER